ncbi:chitin deacetylase [Cyathus striatus]|nr:chitin deacetylase [Cyathus striatus]
MLFTALLSVALATGLVSAVSPIQRRSPAQVVTKCTVPNTVALTFDDGPWLYLYDVGKAIAAAGGHATFFFNGNNYGCIYEADEAKRVKWAFDKGHQVASHTWSHAHLNNLNWDQLHNQFWLVEEAIMKITGAYPAFTRPPYGEYNDLVREVAGARGHTLATWDFDSGDSSGISADQSKQRYTEIANSHPSTILALNHDVYEQTAHVILPHAIQVLQAKGYRFVTLAECLGMSPYQWVGAPQARDSSWTCAGK